jgi:photosystem II stability/assembly factor-like uncharacterized protein
MTLTLELATFTIREGAESAGPSRPRSLPGSPGRTTGADPSDPQRIFVGGHTAVSVSTDGGATWREVDSLKDADAVGWTFTSDAVYVSGHPGLNRSTDDAGHFERVNDGLPSTDVHAFGGTDGALYGASPAVGVFAGSVGDWDVRSTAVGQSFFGRIVVDPADDTHLFAADASAGVAESTDGGQTWNILDSGLPAATWLSRGGDGLAVLVASGPAGAAISSDGGQSWEPLDLPDGASLVEAVPDQADLLYAGSHNGSRVQLHVSRDGGQTWTTL